MKNARFFWSFALFLLAGCHSKTPTENTDQADAPAPPVAVEVVTARVQPMETVVAAQGILAPAPGASARVATLAAGRLTRVLVREGDRVEVGQLLAVVDNRAAQAAQSSASAALEGALADARQADLGVRATQTEQANALRQAQIALQSAQTARAGAVRQAQIALESAQSDLRKARVLARAPDAKNAVQSGVLALQSARLERDASVQGAKNALQSAQIELDKTLAGPRPQEIAQAAATVSQDKITRDRAATEVSRVQFLFEKGIKARRELEDAKTALGVAETNLQSAQEQLDLLQTGARPEDVRAARLGVEGARDALNAAQKSGEAKVREAQNALDLARGNLGQAAGQRPEDLKNALLRIAAAQDALRQAENSGNASVAAGQAALKSASAGQLQIAAKSEDLRAKTAAARGKEADLQAAQIAATSGEIRSPLAGTVFKRLLNPGDMADPTTPILEISDPRGLVLSAQLPAASGAPIRAGMSARLSAESAPGQTFSGVVASVGEIDPQSGLLTVRVAVSNHAGALKNGALAHCDIVVSRRPLAVVVPQSVLLTRDGKNVLMVAQGEVAKEKEVEIGAQSGDLVEIQSGLKRGERVIRLGQYELEDGAAIKIAAAAAKEN